MIDASRRIATVVAAAALAVVLAGCEDVPEHRYPGYVEGEFLYLGAEQSGRVQQLLVSEGDAVASGEIVFRLDAEPWRTRRDEAAARLAESRDRLADLLTGDRPEEIDVLNAGLEQARADMALAEKELRRQEGLRDTPSFRQAVYDRALRDKAAAAARIAEIQNRIAAARLPARSARIAAARDAVAAARTALDEAEWQLQRRSVGAPEYGRIETVLRYPGEMVRQGEPVVSMLARDRLKVRFFVPADEITQISPGQRMRILCDGCPDRLEAVVSFIAREVEFTPPVIYSVEARDKLIFMVEARPVTDDHPLHPGLPVAAEPAS